MGKSELDHLIKQMNKDYQIGKRQYTIHWLLNWPLKIACVIGLLIWYVILLHPAHPFTFVMELITWLGVGFFVIIILVLGWLLFVKEGK